MRDEIETRLIDLRTEMEQDRSETRACPKTAHDENSTDKGDGSAQLCKEDMQVLRSK